MPLKVRKAEKNPVAGVRTFFVQSESDPNTEYIVVEKRDAGTTYFCNCNDFMFRKLPFLGSNLYSNCKHGAAVKEAVSRG